MAKTDLEPKICNTDPLNTNYHFEVDNPPFPFPLGAVHNCQHFHECTNHALSETPSPAPKKSTHQHFLSAKYPHENNKNQAKKLKVYGKNVDFHRPPKMLNY